MSHTNWPFLLLVSDTASHAIHSNTGDTLFAQLSMVAATISSIYHCTCQAHLQCPCMCPCASVGACMYVCIRDFMHVCVCVYTVSYLWGGASQWD